jgi:hypothetical protein
VAGAILTAAPATAQPSSEPGDTWRVTVSPFADLWYHGLAVVGFNGFGAHPLYDVAYGRQAARARPDGPLAREAPGLLEVLESDPAFEVLHFVPVYLAELPPDGALAGLRRIADGRETARGVASDGGLAVIAALLPTPAQRRVLGRFLRALEQERSRGLATALAANRTGRMEQLAAMQARWVDTFAPALDPYLTGRGLGGGRILATPALGLEGRFFQGDPGLVRDNVVIVGLGPVDEGPDATLAPVVRELCYPAVRAAFEDVQFRYADRVAASRASDAAATRCGELLLQRALPEALPAYRTRFGLQGPRASAWSSLPDPAEGVAWDAALVRVLNLDGGS